MARCPPGKEIYRKGSLSVFEVDGQENKVCNFENEIISNYIKKF